MFVFGLRPLTIDLMSEGSLSQVWGMPAIAPTAQNRLLRAEQRDELAAFHGSMPSRASDGNRIAQHCCAAGFQFGLCRLGVRLGPLTMSAPRPLFPRKMG